MDLKNAWFTFTFHGWEMFQPDLKSKLLQPFGIATYKLIKTCVVFTTRFLTKTKNVLPAHLYNDVIYQFVCHCDSRYVGHTSRNRKNTLSNIFPDWSAIIIFLKITLIFFVPARQIVSLKLLPITLLQNSPFVSQYSDAKFFTLSKVVLFTFPLLKLLLSDLFSLTYADTKNLLPKTHLLMLFFFRFRLVALSTNQMIAGRNEKSEALSFSIQALSDWMLSWLSTIGLDRS